MIDEIPQVKVNESKDSEGKITPLSIAIARGFYDMCIYLINKGAKVKPDMFYYACKHKD